jgi:hypothetical protein
MKFVWVQGLDDVLVRADSIVLLAITQDGLRAECASGHSVRLIGTPCSSAVQLALLDEISRAGADERWAVLITPPTEPDSATWHRERVETLLARP